MLRKRFLLLFGAATLVSGLAFTPSQAAEFCTRPDRCQRQLQNCRFYCAHPIEQWAACTYRCDAAYEKCCKQY